MSEKRKNETPGPEAKKAKVIGTISSAPVRYANKAEPDPLPPINPMFQHQIEKIMQDTPVILAEKAMAARGTSYQEALKLAGGTQTKPQYVFPQYAPNKGAANLDSAFSPRFYRAAAGENWEDPTLADWPTDDYRIFVGDLGNEVTDEVLTKSFAKYLSFQRAKVIRDKRTGKSRGYGFISLKDPEDFTRAMREMNGKYIGNRPCKLKKSNWQERADPTAAAAVPVKKKNKVGSPRLHSKHIGSNPCLLPRFQITIYSQ